MVHSLAKILVSKKTPGFRREMTGDKILQAIIAATEKWFRHPLFSPSYYFNNSDHRILFRRDLVTGNSGAVSFS